MICRIWEAAASVANTARYADIARERVLADLRGVVGFRGAVLLSRPGGAGDGGEVRLRFLTFWTSMEAVLAFAGRDPSKAVVLPEAEAVLATHDDTVAHWEVLLHEPVEVEGR